MENENGLLWEVSAWEFVFVTIILAGGAAALAGRAIARTWQSAPRLVTYIALLSLATRFIHFALFDGSLLTPYYLVVDFIVLLVIAFVGKRLTRARLMARQYGFKYDQTGALSWSEKR